MSPGRNDPCPCGSGRKYKKCCLPTETAARMVEAGWIRMRRTEGDLIGKLIAHLDRYYGSGALEAAWADYTLWPDPPAAHEDWPEFDTSFLPWFLFDWDPDPNDPDRDVERPAIPAARHYAEHRGANLDPYERRYIEEACQQPYSFYVVVATVPGQQLTLRDIFRKQEVTVHEQQGSTELRPGQILFTKVVSLDGDAVMLGCAPYPIAARFFDEIVELRNELAGPNEMTAQIIRDGDIEMRQLYLDLREAITNPAPPRLQNTDGDPLQMTHIEYELDCSPQDALTALLPLTLEDDPGAFKNESEYDAAGELIAVEIPWLRVGNAKNPGWANTTLGEVEIRRGSMTVHVNSQARADAIGREIAGRLGPLARQKNVTIESIEQMKAAANSKDSAERAARQRESDELAQRPEVQAMLAEMNAKHWRTWPDIPLPALGGQTPRQAAATPAGRERLDVLLLDFAGREGTPNAMQPDIAALRRELGI